MRICAIDIGSNSVRCLVADADGRGNLGPVARALEITRLAEGMEARRTITAAAQKRTIAAAEGFLRLAERSGAEEYILFGTWALREASNARDFICALRERTGREVRVLSGDEEAALAWRGAVRTLLPRGAAGAVIDIGGGSAEIISAPVEGEIAAKSLPIGCVMMTERFLPSDPPRRGEMDALRDFVAAALSEGIPDAASLRARLIGAGGTVTTAAAILQGVARYQPERIHGSRLSSEAVRTLAESLARMRLEDRKRVPGLEEKRADIIVAGLIALRTVMEFCGAEELTVSDEGILHGAILEYQARRFI